MRKMREEDFNGDIISMVATISMAGFPYLSCSLNANLESEIRVGCNSSDGFLKQIGKDEWAGRFYGVKFRLQSRDVKVLVENAFEIAYIDCLSYVGCKNKEVLKKYI